MSYPTTLDSFTTKTDNVDVIYASHVNDLQTAVVNIETTLGIDPWKSVTLDDDDFESWTPAKTQGVVIVYTRDDTGNIGSICSYKVGAGCFLRSIVLGSDMEITTGALAGTTGTDVKVTLSVHTDGKIYLENRLGGTKYFGVVRLGQ